ncbi:MAG: copper amine oxidase N-terminal domain-containing protein [Bacillota bacterium]
MLLKRITIFVVFIFLMMNLLSLPQFSVACAEEELSASAGTDAASVNEGTYEDEAVDEDAYEEDAVDEDAYEKDRGPAWARGEHPSLKGLRRAYANVCRNQASLRAQEVLRGLIEARTVTDSIYLFEQATGEEEDLGTLTGNEEVKQALAAEAKRIREEARRQLRERQTLAWALKKLGRSLEKLGERVEAEKTLIEAAGITPQDESIYEYLNDLYAELKGAQVPVFIKGKKTDFDVPPQIVSRRMLVPLRKFAETLGCTVDWDSSTRQVVLVRGNRVVVLGVGQNTATVDGEQVALDVAAVIVNGRVLVPIRFVSETLDAEVDYHAESSMVVVN